MQADALSTPQVVFHLSWQLKFPWSESACCYHFPGACLKDPLEVHLKITRFFA